MNRSLRKALPLIAALALATGVAAAAGPLTPLGNWMKPNMGAVFLPGATIQRCRKNFGVVGSKPPPSGDYGQWSTLREGRGTDAAGKQDAAAVKAACKSCHDNYKEKYPRKDFPTRAFP